MTATTYPPKTNEWPGKIVMPDGIYKDKSTGLWYYTAHGVTYTGFGSYQEVVEWLKT